MRKLTQVLLLTILFIALLGAAGCQDEFDEVCAFAKSAVEVTRQILDGADRVVVAAKAGVEAACSSFGIDCSEALAFLQEAEIFVVEARSNYTKAKLLVDAVCTPDGTLVAAESLTASEMSYARREAKSLKSWIKKHGGQDRIE